ncbi:uncharacterized protein FTJAE_3061 [Fusarium tjaetaba]|uniref:Uncharacterized protein n=1 Tax=Fusarium tjaetaba TaxID=1567544 RepID=A0A8H5S418_9HYPO|nr:uncharacterized protein FTJAE_3061 [Fusarium tjaetaba]KAF5643762.1 hypothetical protein FTJAE_3061 [Fusarium tjaetaba]
MPTVIPSYEYPEASLVDTFDRDARIQYFFDVATYFGALDHQVLQVTRESCTQRVCSDFHRMDEWIVDDATFHYTLESAIWEMFFRHLGDEAPEFPWTLDHFPLRAYNVPDIYREWRIANGLKVACSMSPSPTRSEDGS